MPFHIDLVKAIRGPNGTPLTVHAAAIVATTPASANGAG